MASRFQESSPGALARWRSGLRVGPRNSALLLVLFLLAETRLLPAAHPEEGKQKAVPLLAAPQILFGPAGEGKAVAERIIAGHLSEAEAAADRELRIATSLQAGAEIDPTKRLQSASSMLGFAFRVAVPYNNLGVVYTLQKRYAEAHKTISRAIGIQRAALSQAQTDTTFNSTLAYIQAGRGAGKIVEQQRKFLAILLLNNALVYRIEGDAARAAQFDAEAHRLDPTLPKMAPLSRRNERPSPPPQPKHPKETPHPRQPPPRKKSRSPRPGKEFPAFWAGPFFMNEQVIPCQGGKERLDMRRLFRCHRLDETAFPFKSRWGKGLRTGSFDCQFSRRNRMVRWAVEGAPLSGGGAIGRRLFTPGHCPRWAGGGAAGLGAGLLRAQGSGSVDWMERRTAGWSGSS
ncbi:hypothetical protein [Verrucomicrobium sp. 3C]|uniref:hypothetical protein n=1 Tax=Verrucomicrobium sp. 3C TaxID=1134055 RepID=UPI00037992E6|nr:hypothetical protein [Verrucomicrobium sp. 3C]